MLSPSFKVIFLPLWWNGGSLEHHVELLTRMDVQEKSESVDLGSTVTMKISAMLWVNPAVNDWYLYAATRSTASPDPACYEVGAHLRFGSNISVARSTLNSFSIRLRSEIEMSPSPCS